MTERHPRGGANWRGRELRHLPGDPLPWQWHSLTPHGGIAALGYLCGHATEEAARAYGETCGWPCPKQEPPDDAG